MIPPQFAYFAPTTLHEAFTLLRHYGSEAKLCGAALTDKGQQITRIGKDMIERGQKMQDKPIAPAK